jgi:Na+/H+-dicarboxylate symporter
MMSIGKASTVGSLTFALYLVTTVMAAVWGCLATLAFKGLYETESFAELPPPYIVLGCSEEGSFLAESTDGNVVCSSNVTMDDPKVNFILNDVSKTIVTSSGTSTELSLSDTVYQGIFQKTVPDNIMRAFSDNNFAAIIFFGILFGIALQRVVLEAKGKQSQLMNVLSEADRVFTRIICWIIFLTPFAVCSLIASAIGGESDLAQMFKNIGYLVAASLTAMGLQVVIVYIGLFALITHRNAFSYLSKMIPAQTMAFASSSSAATIPTTLACVRSTGFVHETVARFVVPVGATVNLDGAAM